MVLAKPGSIKPHTQFEAEVYVLTQRGRRAAYAFFKATGPVLLPHDDVTGSVELRRAWRW